MIAFSCLHCGTSLKVKAEFAGRATHCPTCRRPVTVPVSDRTQATVPSGPMGPPSSVVQVGFDAGVTLPQGDTAARAGRKPLPELLARHGRSGERYVIEGEVARGGMGAVLRAVDCDIRREVAVKYLLNQADARSKTRFVEEAQITGQLEHPSIVPIHELGVDAQKRLFFTMKMVQGRSLAQILDGLREDPKSAEKEWSLARLLNILVAVCHALAYAHARGVVHRDLKPANIMVGDFGEVYVMDWGLAKVLQGTSAAPVAGAAASVPQAPTAVPVTGSGRSSKVITSREAAADLTQDGAVLGTPVYMPPEQATGRINEIDRRSDVYGLGAILYEMLTLRPPVEKDGGQLAVLLRVSQGEIVPPERRDPKRARAGKVPRELSAMAMKALARSKENRYPTAEALRRDIERFQEGRSVSAKDDNVREAVWKLVKRNKVVTFVSAVALLLGLCLWSWMASINAEQRRKTESAQRKAEQERQDKYDQARKSVPAYLRAARYCVSQKQFDDALDQVNIALLFDPGNADAQLLRGKILMVKQKFRDAEGELQQYLQQRPDDTYARKLAELCRRTRANDPRTVAPIVELLLEQNESDLALGMGDFQDRILESYRRRIDKAWPGLGRRLKLDAGGKLVLNLDRCGNQVTDLAPLQGIPLTGLNLQGTGVPSLKPLTGMPLTSLNLIATGTRDLGPLKGMKLTSLLLSGCWELTDLAPLKGMPLTDLGIDNCQVSDLKPLRGMITLRHLGCYVTRVTDLTPLEGLDLQTLAFSPRKIVKGMDVLEQMPSLHMITVQETAGEPIRHFSSVDFWKRHSAGEFSAPPKP